MKNLIIFGLFFLCIIGIYLYPHAMINPGELLKGHQKLNNSCNSCHEPFWGISNEKCISCHAINKIGMDTLWKEDSLNKKKINFHTNLSAQNCTSCHTDHKGLSPAISIGKFNHDIINETIRNQCSSCHQQPEDKVHKFITATCNNCHNTKGWKSDVSFNHQMIQGADKENCSACHQTPTDSFHGTFKDNCSKCHLTNKWVPSSFNHSNYFQLDRNHNAKCVVCHVDNNFKKYTCYGCHEHSEGSILGEHREEGITNLNNCVACHKSGNEHEGRESGKSEGRNSHGNEQDGGDDD